MKQIKLLLAIALLTASTAFAGGVERSDQSTNILFEPGRYVELSYRHVWPNVKGSMGDGAFSSGNVSPTYNTFALGGKMDITPDTAFALIIDQPIGGSVEYPTNTGYLISGTTASLESMGATGILRHRTAGNISFFGGLRGNRVRGQADMARADIGVWYTMKTDWDTGWGYLIGAGYEKPEMALKASVTYNSPTRHTFSARENNAAVTSFDTTLPRSVNVYFQTGIAADTLLFASARWVEWKVFDVSPRGFTQVTGLPLLGYSQNTITWRLGLGRKLSETWSGAVSLGYEKRSGRPVGNLGPTDGMKSVAVAARYRFAQGISIMADIEYARLGKATTMAPVSGTFSDSRAISTGLKIGYHF